MRSPLFGYGLSYTTFARSNLHVSAGSVSKTGTLTVSADLTNTGSVAGDGLVQLYTHQDGTSSTGGLQGPSSRFTSHPQGPLRSRSGRRGANPPPRP